MAYESGGGEGGENRRWLTREKISETSKRRHQHGVESVSISVSAAATSGGVKA